MVDLARLALRTANSLGVGVYRASGGRVMGKVGGVKVLLLTVAGRTSGVERTTPVGYFEDGGRFIVTGSAGGSPSEPQWFRNLRRARRARIQVGSQQIDVSVAIAEPDQREMLWQVLIALAPGFEKYQAKTDRTIPMAVLTPA